MNKKQTFEEWHNGFEETNATYDYITDFEKVYKNLEQYEDEYHLLDALIGSNDIENRFRKLVSEYPEVLKAIPSLLARRESEIKVAESTDGGETYHTIIYNFNGKDFDVEQYVIFMRNTGLFDLLSRHIIDSVHDYMLGVEVGLDSNGRKNRSGHFMEDRVQYYLEKTGLKFIDHRTIEPVEPAPVDDPSSNEKRETRPIEFKYRNTYFKELTYEKLIELFPGYKFDNISEEAKRSVYKKRFDFAFVGLDDEVYAIECNFYSNGGSKPGAIAQDYILLNSSIKQIPKLNFIWVTDGGGWGKEAESLKPAYESIEYLYSLKDLHEGAFDKFTHMSDFLIDFENDN